jgi:peptidoglycan hydrolase-like protein with peptidoglycan-binding domain
MKKAAFIALGLVMVMHLAGCGKKQQSLEEMQEPMSIEALSTIGNQPQTVPEMKGAEVKPQVVPESIPAVSATEPKLEMLPPSGPYKPSVNEIQTALKNTGFYTGNIDGKSGPKTKQAIEAFQKANNLQVDGKVGPKTWAALSAHLNPAPVVTEKR